MCRFLHSDFLWGLGRPNGLSPSNLLHGASGLGAASFFCEQPVGLAGARGVVLVFDQKPVCVPFLWPWFHADQRPLTMQFVALETKFQMSACIGFLWVPRQRVPRPAVPNHDGATAVLSVRDDTFERPIFLGMVFGFDCEAAHGRIDARPFR